MLVGVMYVMRCILGDCRVCHARCVVVENGLSVMKCVVSALCVCECVMVSRLVLSECVPSDV